MFQLTSAAFYIDPATTSYIIQIAVGAVVAIGAVLGIFGNKLKRLFRKKKEGEAQPAARTLADDRKKDISTADLLGDEDDNDGAAE